jgi:hypothetical protein
VTVKEMIYVLDKEKECIQRRGIGKCEKECKACESYIEPSNLLDAFERIINYIFNVDKTKTRKGGY